MPMPSESLTTSDRILIQILSGILFVFSGFWCDRARSVGIANFPMGFALFCKHARPFASNETRAKVFEERKNYNPKASVEANDRIDPLEDPSFAKLCLVWSMAQLLCVVSGIFDWYPDIIVKGTVIFRILLSVQDSVQTRPIKEQQEEMRQKRKQKQQLESAQFWRFILPRFLWKWLGFEKAVARATGTITPKTSERHETEKDNKKSDLAQKVHTTKQVIQGRRETAVDDLIWGAIEIAYVAFDVTHKQAIGTAFMVYLCTLLENVLTTSPYSRSGNVPEKKQKIQWFKLVWISLCVYFTGRWCFS